MTPDEERFDRGIRRLKEDLLKAGLEDIPLVVLGQGTSKRTYYGDDFRVTNLAPLLRRVARRFAGALLSFLRVRR